MSMPAEVWPAWRNAWIQNPTIRSHPKFKQAVQAYNSVSCLEMTLRRGARGRDVKNAEVVSFAMSMLKTARGALDDLGILQREEFDAFARMHIEYISRLLCDY